MRYILNIIKIRFDIEYYFFGVFFFDEDFLNRKP